MNTVQNREKKQHLIGRLASEEDKTWLPICVERKGKSYQSGLGGSVVSICSIRPPETGVMLRPFIGYVTTRGATVTVMYNPEGSVYGGYISQPWQSSGSYNSDGTAFVFRLRRNGVLQLDKFGLKLNQTCNAYFRYDSYGPTFGGGHDLPYFTNTIKKSSDYFNLNGTLSFGYTYDMRGEDAKSIHNDHQNVKEIEVYEVKGISKNYSP